MYCSQVSINVINLPYTLEWPSIDTQSIDDQYSLNTLIDTWLTPNRYLSQHSVGSWACMS